MDKRKKLVKLFNDIKMFIESNSIETSSYAFLLNRFYLSVNNKRPGTSSLSGISRNDFSLINREFEDRLKRDFVLSLSVSAILSLPAKKVFEIDNLKTAQKASVLIMTDSIVLSYEIEKRSLLFIGYNNRDILSTPFGNIEFYPVSKDAPLSISLQATLFDMISDDQITLKPHSFDIVLDDAVNYGFPSENLIENISSLLKTKGEYHIAVKKNFLSSPLTKKHKKLLYSFFQTNEINRFSSFLHVKLEKKSESFFPQTGNIVIKDYVENRVMKLEKEHLDFNNLLTFDDGIRPEQISIISKIESKATHSCGEWFRFFIGMFKEGGAEPAIEHFRKSSRFKPFVRSKDIEPYSSVAAKQYVIPDKETFFQIPPFENFEREKLVLRYLSVKPVFSYDNSGLYFLNDVAAVIPRTNEIDPLFAEGYFNSKVIEYYYRIKFPHHSKFLKKNFNKIPFFMCSRNIQKIIADLVAQIREAGVQISMKAGAKDIEESRLAKLHQLDKFMYQLFKLTPEEVRIIEESLDHSS
jgi:hypothetical protein